MAPSRFQIRHLCLLVLLQLVIGPLVLMQVSLFCGLTVREAPQHGVAKAMVKAWNNERFQGLLSASNTLRVADSSAALPGTSSKVKSPVIKLSLIAWNAPAALPARTVETLPYGPCIRVWTHTSAQAPPGPPPRVV